MFILRLFPKNSHYLGNFSIDIEILVACVWIMVHMNRTICRLLLFNIKLWRVFDIEY